MELRHADPKRRSAHSFYINCLTQITATTEAQGLAPKGASMLDDALSARWTVFSARTRDYVLIKCTDNI